MEFYLLQSKRGLLAPRCPRSLLTHLVGPSGPCAAKRITAGDQGAAAAETAPGGPRQLPHRPARSSGPLSVHLSSHPPRGTGTRLHRCALSVRHPPIPLSVCSPPCRRCAPTCPAVSRHPSLHPPICPSARLLAPASLPSFFSFPVFFLLPFPCFSFFLFFFALFFPLFPVPPSPPPPLPPGLCCRLPALRRPRPHPAPPPAPPRPARHAPRRFRVRAARAGGAGMRGGCRTGGQGRGRRSRSGCAGGGCAG